MADEIDPQDETLDAEASGEPASDATEMADDSNNETVREETSHDVSSADEAGDKDAVADAEDPDSADSDVRDAGSDEVAKAKASRPVKRNRTVGPVKKDKPTPRQKTAAEKIVEDAEKRVGPGQFVKQSVAELKKVFWPTRLQAKDYFIMVVAFVVFIMAFVSLLDYGFGWTLLKIFG